jgi:hypothetical protein
MARLLASALLLLATALWHHSAAASADDSCDPTWMLAHRERTGCVEMAILQPGNDTRVNLLLLTLDRRGKRITAPAGGETPDPFGEWPTFAERFAAAPPTAEDGSDEYASGEGSRCLSNKAGAAAFVEQVKSATEIPEPERATLIAVREGLAPDCAAAARTGGAAIAKALEPVQSPPGKSFATYVRGAQAFYDGDYDAAKTHFASLTSVKQPWLAETARYMLARVEVNRAQVDAFDEFGTRTETPIDPKVIDAAEAGFRDYLSAYPKGIYADSARGLLRRVYWLGGRTRPLGDAYVAILAAGTPGPGGIDDVAILDEIDDKLLMPSESAAGSDPILLAVEDLVRMRDGRTIGREEIERQRASFASNPALLEYLLAAHDLYVANKPDAVLAAIPAAAPQAPLSHLEFSRQMLRGMALEAQKDAGAREHWMALLPAAVQPLQRPAVELALALHDEQAGLIDAVFAADSPIGNATMRETLLRKIADADLLRRQAQDATRPQHERDVALYVLLYKELTRGRYDDFIKDLALVRADAPTEGYTGDASSTETPPLGVFTQTTQLGDYDCPPLKDTAAKLAKDPKSPKAQLCLADFLRANGFDLNMLDWQPKEPQLGNTVSRFAGKPYARFEIYKALIADPKTPANDRAYALYRAVNCYAPAQSNSCGGEDVPQKQRKAWFQQLKKSYPNSTWAKELKLYW